MREHAKFVLVLCSARLPQPADYDNDSDTDTDTDLDPAGDQGRAWTE
ncbi:hypothetical protein JXA88_08085 [Candidatus Fermentibacteria bacterium]|nr:hypothetical protein [Candidatus Fermentibacteria bacterium]